MKLMFYLCKAKKRENYTLPLAYQLRTLYIMQDRIKKILEYSKLTQSQFSDKIAMGAATLSNILNAKTKPSLELIQNIRLAFPEINPIWLLDGIGEMISSSDSNPSEPTSGNSQDINLDFIPDDLFSVPVSPAVTKPVNSNPGSAVNSSVQSPAGRQPLYFAENPANPKEIQMVKIIDKPMRKVTQIQLFYDDDTFEVFVPRK